MWGRASRPHSQGRGKGHGLVGLALAIGLAAVASLVFETNDRDIEGRAHVVDGDTLQVAGRTIRLKGIDAPELHQECLRNGVAYRCGEIARSALAAAIAGQTVRCSASGRDRYQRILAFCSIEGSDLGAKLVGEGLALSYGDYRLQETKARLSRVGLWSGAFESPQEWRRQNPR